MKVEAAILDRIDTAISKHYLGVIADSLQEYCTDARRSLFAGLYKSKSMNSRFRSTLLHVACYWRRRNAG